DENNETASQICLAMGAPSRNSIISKVHRLGLAVRVTAHANGARRSNSSRPRKANRNREHYHTVRAVLRAEQPGGALPVFTNAKPLLALQDRDCRWPGTGHGAELLFCAAPAVDGCPYCLAHCRAAYIATSPKAPRNSGCRS